MRSTTRRVALIAGLALTAAVTTALSPRVARQGDAEHRAKLAEIEAKPFALDTLAALTEWVGGDAVTGEQINAGGVIAFAFIDVQNSTSMVMLNTLTRMARVQGEQGLSVFAVHPAESWEEIKRLAEDNRLRIPVALDAEGAFRKAMGADGTPDLYLIDRAGQLRFADIESRALPVAVNMLLREDAAEAVANAALEAASPAVASTEAEPSERPGRTQRPERRTVTEADYRSAEWPAHNTGRLSGKNVQGSPLPVPMGRETWITPRQDLSGRVIVLDFWATWCGPCIRVMPALDQFQKEHPEQLAILGVAGQGEDLGTVRQWLNRNPHSYGQLFDPQQRVYRSLEIRGIPHVAVLSTDGVVRWQGHPGSPEFRKAVEQVLKVDPGLR
ncbi:MAG: TlpA family protein disulfide reductase [Phycisphaerales bacterium]|nr:redoxin family protein [Planctomycetota bacterium]MCH8509660.1 TlpA family protein disulfide reductase [Phycisphaerales bacterium]